MTITSAAAPLLEGLREAGLIETGDRVLAAVSGGPDSTSLLVALCEEGYDVVAAHYDHALQAGSLRAAEHVRALCHSMGVPLVVERRTSPLPRGSIQAGARALRYDFLERVRSEVGANVVALGHTADDLVEGVVLHLMRGCGLAGLRGMPVRRGPFVRPLLRVWRRDVVDYVRAHGLVALEDPANSNLTFARARVRHEILPALERARPGIIGRFYAVAQRAAAMQESIHRDAASALDSGRPARSELVRLDDTVAAEALRLLYARAGGVQPSLSRSHIKSMLRLLQPGRGGRGVDLPGGLKFRIVGDSVQIAAQETHPPTEQRQSPRLVVTSCAGCDRPGVAHLRPGLQLRIGYRHPGLRMRPLGGRGTRKLQDIFVDARVPRASRDSWPLVFAGDRLAWVPGIAIDAELASAPGASAQHVTVVSAHVPGDVKTLC